MFMKFELSFLENKFALLSRIKFSFKIAEELEEVEGIIQAEFINKYTIEGEKGALFTKQEIADSIEDYLHTKFIFEQEEFKVEF